MNDWLMELMRCAAIPRLTERSFAFHLPANTLFNSTNANTNANTNTYTNANTNTNTKANANTNTKTHRSGLLPPVGFLLLSPQFQIPVFLVEMVQMAMGIKAQRIATQIITQIFWIFPHDDNVDVNVVNVDANKTLWFGFWPVSMSAQSNTPSGGNLPISQIRLKI